MKVRVVVAFAALVLLTAACSAGGGTGISSSDDVSEALNPDTEPVIVTTTVDKGRAVSARIGPDGGTLAATGADGSRYSLEIPAGALVEETVVRMTPITSMEGLPVTEGLAAGVQLEPEGTAFYDFVTLTIEPSESLPVEQTLPIGSSGKTGAVYIPLIDLDPNNIRLRLMHFSSAGLSKGLTSDLEPVRQRLGGDVEARVSSLLSAEMAWARQQGQSEPPMVALEYLIKVYREHVLNPRLAAAGESCAAARLAILSSGFYRRMRVLASLSDDSEEEVDKIIPTYTKVCLQEEYELCRDKHIVHRMLPVISHMEKVRNSRGLFTAEMDQIMAHAQELAHWCLHFELEFESTARMESEGTYNESEMESKIEISYDPGSLPPTVTGSSALVNLNYEVSDPPGGACTATGNRGGGTFEVTNLRFETGRTDDGDQVSHVVDIQLTYGPGISTETITATCPGAGTLTTPPTSIWSNTYMGVHQSELGGTGGANLLATNRQSQLDSEASGGQPPPIPKLTIEQLQGLLQSGAPPEGLSVEDAGQGATYTTKGWEVKGGELFAQKEWDLALSTEGVSLTEDGSFKLYHRPQ